MFTIGYLMDPIEQTAAPTLPEADLAEVTIIIVTYESAHCVPLLANFLRDFPKVIVVDNGSNDETVALVRSFLPLANLIELGRNLGFGAANNKALDQVVTRFALLLNPDCELNKAAVLGLIREAHLYPEAAIIAPQLINRRGECDLSYRWPSTIWRSQGPTASGTACVGFVSGAAMLLRLDKMEDSNRFDQRFFLYYEDDDLCLRNFNARHPILVVPAVTVTHRSRGSVRGKAQLKTDFLRGFHHIQSKIRFTEIHIGAEKAKRLRVRYFIVSALVLPLRLIVFSPRLVARWTGRILGLAKWRPSA